MNLHVRDEHHLQGLECADDLFFQRLGGAELGDDVGAEDLHLRMGEVGVCKSVSRDR